MMITISHTHADGTVLSGSTRGDGVWEIVREHGFRYSRSVGIYIRGSRDRDANRVLIDAAAQALRAAGYEVAVVVDDTWRPAAEREADRQARAGQRVQRLTSRAQAANARGEAARARAQHIADGIPFGQPILVGHHSQRRHEKDADRIEQSMRKAAAEDRYAQQLAGRARGAARHEEHRQDPRAMTRRIERLEAELRRWQRDGGSRAEREVQRLAEEIDHLRGKLADLAASGEYVPWGPEHFRKGDEVRVLGGWLPVRRVNRKTVSVPGGYGMAGVDASWSETVPWDKVTGRRRDGWQWETPNGEPWPVEQARKVARWQGLVAAADRAGMRSDEPVHRHVRWARRMVHGLPLDAGTPQLAAYETQVTSVESKRRLAVACVDVFDRLEAGEAPSQITAGLTPFGVVPAWSLPEGEPQPCRVDRLRPGDLVAGIWQRGTGGLLRREFAGPVEHVSTVVDRRERGQWVTVTLAGGESQALPVHAWAAVFPSD